MVPWYRLWAPVESRKQELGADFSMAFVAAWIYCASIASLSVMFAKRVFGHTFTGLSEPKKVLWHVYSYCLITGLISSSFLFGDLGELFYEHGLDADFHFNGAPVSGFRRALGFSCGFLAFDTAVTLLWHKQLLIAYKKPLYIQMLVHHALSIGFWPQTAQRKCAMGYVSYCILTESTSVFINLHWLFREAKLDVTILGYINSVCLFFSFLFIRILPIPWIVYMWWNSSKAEWLWCEWAFGCFLIPLPPLFNMYWFSFILKGAGAVFFPDYIQKRPKKEPTEKKE